MNLRWSPNLETFIDLLNEQSSQRHETSVGAGQVLAFFPFSIDERKALFVPMA